MPIPARAYAQSCKSLRPVLQELTLSPARIRKQLTSSPERAYAQAWKSSGAVPSLRASTSVFLVLPIPFSFHSRPQSSPHRQAIFSPMKHFFPHFMIRGQEPSHCGRAERCDLSIALRPPSLSTEGCLEHLQENHEDNRVDEQSLILVIRRPNSH